MILWHPAQTGLARCCSMRSRTDVAAALARIFLERRNVGRRQGRRTAEQILQNPFAALHRRSAIRVGSDQQHASLPQQAAARIARNGNAAEVGTVDIRRCHNAWPDVRSRKYSRRREDPERSGPRAPRFQTAISVSRWNAWRRLSSKSGNSRPSGLELFRSRR